MSVQVYVLDLQSNSAVINSTVVIAVAQDMVSHFDSNILNNKAAEIGATTTWFGILDRFRRQCSERFPSYMYIPSHCTT